MEICIHLHIHKNLSFIVFKDFHKILQKICECTDDFLQQK